MVSDATNVQFGNAVKGQFGRFATENVRDATQDIRRGDGRKVLVKGKERHVLVGLVRRFEESLLKAAHTGRILHRIKVEAALVQDLQKGRFHVLVVARVQKELHFAVLDERRQRLDKVDNELALGPGSADGNQDANGFLGCGSLDATQTVRVNVLHHVSGTPVSRPLQFVGFDAHAQEGVIVDGSLHNVERPWHREKPL